MNNRSRVQDVRAQVEAMATTGTPVVLGFEELRVEVHSNSSKLLQTLKDYFAPFLTDEPVSTAQEKLRVFASDQEPVQLDVEFDTWPREPGKDRLKEEVAVVDGWRLVRKVRTDMQFICGDEDHYAFGPCLQNANQIINFVGSRFISHYLHRGWQLCHAAGVAADGAGLAIAGLSGGGKSTLALHLMRTGLDYVSNDRVLIKVDGDQGTRMIGVPKLPRINPGTAMHNPNLAHILPAARLAALRQMDPEQLWDLEEKYDVDIDRAFGAGRMQKNVALCGVVVLNWARQAQSGAQLRLAGLRQREDLLGALMKGAGPFYAPAGAGPIDGLHMDPEGYLRQLEGTPSFEMVGRVDFAAAVHECATLLREAAALRA